MSVADVLTLLALALALTHFSIPLLYYLYLRSRWLNKPWDIKKDPSYRPRVTIIVPTYNEADLIESKLDNIFEQDYPKDLMSIIVVDSASTDGTLEIVERWRNKHPDVRLVIIRENFRRGMVHALNYALGFVSSDSEIIIFTDVDSFWDADALKRVVSYFADPSVGAVTASIKPSEWGQGLESSYRGFYNEVRIAESKIHSTPISNGALIIFRKVLLNRIKGLPTYTGNNDSTPASLIAFMGYRAIQVDDTIVREPISRNQFMRKIRRAQHLILHFLYTKRYAKKLGIYRKTLFDKIWHIESYLHLVNPWILLVTVILILLETLRLQPLAIIMLIIGMILLFFKPYRTWIETQIQLILATVRNLWTKEIVWKK
ncbi:MAG: glycosyltransferase [Desulfurococcaceae archaeon]|nr:glycosyltransferase [Desulfurococcaceae archaeon]